MRAKFVFPFLLAGLLGLAACDIEDIGGFGRYPKDFHYSYPLKAGGRLSVESFNGAVEVSGWDQEMVDISGTKYGPGPDSVDSLKIEISNSSDAVSVHAVRPSDFRGRWGARFSIRAPRRAVLDLINTSNGEIHLIDGSGPGRYRTSNAAIRVETFQGSLDVQTSNGPVDLTDVTGEAVVHTSNGRIHTDHLRGSLQAATSNGPINADLAAPGDRPLRLQSSNGPVTVTLPSKFSSDVRVNTSNGPITLHMPFEVNARVQARTSNSSVTSDFEVRMQGEFGKNHMDGSIGTGGPLLDLTTSNGPIRLLKM